MGAVDNPKKNVPIAVMTGTLIAAVLYIVSTNVIAGIVPNADLANSSAPFGLAFAHIFNPTVGKIVVGLMVISCFGSLFAWQFTIAEVARSSAIVGYFPKLFRRSSRHGAPIVGICVITAAQTVLSFMTVSPSLNKQFTLLLNLAVMTNLIPYLLCMAALMALQKIELVPPKLARKANIVAVVATVYSLYALYSSGEQAMLYGGIVTFAGWMLYGLVAGKLQVREAPESEMLVDEEPALPEFVAGRAPGRGPRLSAGSTAAPPSYVIGPGRTPGSMCDQSSDLLYASASASPTDHPMWERPGTTLGIDTRDMAIPRLRSSAQAAAMPSAPTTGEDEMRPGLSGCVAERVRSARNNLRSVSSLNS